MSNETQNNMPAEYNPAFDNQAYKLCLLYQSSVKQMADFFGTTEDSLVEWRSKFPGFTNALRDGKIDHLKKVMKEGIGATCNCKREPLTPEEIRYISQCLEEEY